MIRSRALMLLFGTVVCCALLPLWGCGAQGGGAAATTQDAAAPAQGETNDKEKPAGATQLADGTYNIEVETDSSMFRADSCLLTVEGGTYRVALSLPGEGFSRLYWGSADQAQQAPEEDIYDYYVNDQGKYTFDLPVSALEEELPIAAFGHRREKWYDHTIVFHVPTNQTTGQTDAS